MKFLVLWRLDTGRPGPDLIKAIAQQPNYGKKLEADGKLECRYHLIGQHGGAWIYKVKSDKELDLLLAMAPVYNYARYEVLPLADMADPATYRKARLTHVPRNTGQDRRTDRGNPDSAVVDVSGVRRTIDRPARR